MWINDPGIANLMIMHYVSCVLHNKKITCVECCWIAIAISFPSNFIAIWFQHRDGYFFKKHKDQRTKTKTKKQFYRLFLLKIISNCFQPHKNYPRNISVYLVCVSTLCSASVCDMCDCFYRGWHSGNIITWQLPMCPLRLIHWPWVRGLTQKRSLSIKLEVSRRWPEADSFPICKLSVFIYLLLNDLRFKPIGHFFPSVKRKKKGKKTTQSFFLLIICHWHIKVKDWGVTLTAKFSLHLRWMPLKVYPLIPISACVIPAPLRHTFPLPLPCTPSPFSTQLSLPCFNQSNANPSRHNGLR